MLSLDIKEKLIEDCSFLINKWKEECDQNKEKVLRRGAKGGNQIKKEKKQCSNSVILGKLFSKGHSG